MLEEQITEWETEKEEILSKAEQARNEQAQEIEKLEQENTQLDTDLNKAIDLLESKDIILNQKDKTISQLQAKNGELNKTIADLKNQAKSTEKNNPEPIKTLNESKLFLCSDCQQEKPQTELSRVFNKFSFCLECSKKARKQAQQEKPNPEPQTFTCVVCEEQKQEVPTYKKVDISYKTHLIKGKEYPVCSTCAIHVKEYNEHENQEFYIGED